MSDINFKCEICGHSYSTKFTLKRHMRVKHPPDKSFPSFISSCNCSIDTKLISNSTEFKNDIKNRLKCPLCNYITYISDKLNEHLKIGHDINIETETHQFKSFEEFLEWKLNVEKCDISKFVKYCGNSKIKDGSIRSYYYCHRSYVHKPRALNRMKMLKKQGLVKIGSHCPASMKVVKKKDGLIKVYYVKTHLGHEKEICYINFSDDERKYLFSLISKNMSFNDILNDIRNSSDLIEKNSKLKFVTKSDLHNIRRSFNLYKAGKTSGNHDDFLKTDCWVKQHQIGNNACILLYKPPGLRIDEYPELVMDDFLLAIMSKDQETLLLQQSFTCLCMDLIRSTNVNERRFELLTLSVTNNSEVYPSAFLISSRTDYQIVKLFLSIIKSKVGVLTANIFLSNVKDFFYDVWWEVMKTPSVKLYSTWNVNRRWRLSLQKIISPEDELAYDIVRKLIDEKDKILFTEKLKTSIEILCSNHKTHRFGEYFKEAFANNPETWAYCYRKEHGLDNDVEFERIHRTLKYLFVSVKTLKRLDKSLIEIKKFVHERFFGVNKFPLNEVKILKMREIKNRHRTSLRLKLDSYMSEENFWRIKLKTRMANTYSIYDLSPNCNCSIICVPCDVCIHRFCCSCNDSSVMWRMCKHIHLLCRTVKLKRPEKLYPKDVCELTSPIIDDSEPKSSDPQRVDSALQVGPESSGLDGLVESIYLNKMSVSDEEDNAVKEKKALLNNKFCEILELVHTEIDACLIQTSLDLLLNALSGKDNDELPVVPVTNELKDDSLPIPPLVLIKPTTVPNSNTVTINTQINPNENKSNVNINGISNPPIPPLIPLKRKDPQIIFVLDQDDSTPFPIKVNQENIEPHPSSTRNMMVLPNQNFSAVNR